MFAISSDAMKSNFNLNSTTFVTIKYPSNGIVKTITKSYLVDGITLFSNIGGGLGLALGFSMYSVIDYIIEKSGSKIKKAPRFEGKRLKPDVGFAARCALSPVGG